MSPEHTPCRTPAVSICQRGRRRRSRGCRYAQGVPAAMRLQGEPVAALPQGVASAARTQGMKENDGGLTRLVVLLHPLSEATPPEAKPASPERSGTPRNRAHEDDLSAVGKRRGAVGLLAVD